MKNACPQPPFANRPKRCDDASTQSIPNNLLFILTFNIVVEISCQSLHRLHKHINLFLPEIFQQCFKTLDCSQLHLVFAVLEQGYEYLDEGNVSDFLAETFGQQREVHCKSMTNSPGFVLSSRDNYWECVSFVFILG